MSGAEALAVAKAATPDPAPAHDPTSASGLTPGQAVTVRADDYGRDPIDGRLVAATAERVIIAREDPAVGLVHVHFPRAGYLLAAA
jgi:glutathione S-transferase